MFDMGWWEFAIVGVIVILVLGPKELPHAMRSVARFMRKARRLASEFQGHMDDLIREAELDEVKQTVRSIKNQDVNKLISDTVDPGGEFTKELNDTMADAQREMNEIKSAAGPKPTSSPSPTPLPMQDKDADSKPAVTDEKPSTSASNSPATKQADTPSAAAGSA